MKTVGGIAFSTFSHDKVLPISVAIGSIFWYVNMALTDWWKPYKKVSMASKVFGYAGSPVAYGGQPVMVQVSPMAQPQYVAQPQHHTIAYVAPQPHHQKN